MVWPAVCLTMLRTGQRMETHTDEHGFTGRRLVTFETSAPVTLCANNLRASCIFAAGGRPGPHFCMSPATCHQPHHDNRTLGAPCAAALAGNPCSEGCNRVHFAEFPRIVGPDRAATARASGAVEARRIGGVRHAAPVNRPATMMCWKWLCEHLGIHAAKCTGCSFAHGKENQAKHQYAAEFASRQAAGTLITQRHVDEVIRVLTSASEEQMKVILECCRDGVLPDFNRASLSLWLRAWYCASNKLRAGADKSALALFGEAKGMEEYMVWETVRRLHTCHASREMAAKFIFGASSTRLVAPRGEDSKLASGCISVCKGGHSCLHGAHFSETIGEAPEQLSANDLDGKENAPARSINAAALIAEHATKLAALTAARDEMNRKGVPIHIKKDAETRFRELSGQMEVIRAKYFNSFASARIFASDAARDAIIVAPVGVDTAPEEEYVYDPASFKELAASTAAPVDPAEEARRIAAAKAYEARKQAAIAARLAEVERIRAQKAAAIQKQASLAADIYANITAPEGEDKVEKRKEIDVALLEMVYDFQPKPTGTAFCRHATVNGTGKPIIYTDADGKWFVPIAGTSSFTETDAVKTMKPAHAAFAAVTVADYEAYAASGASAVMGYWEYIKPNVRDNWTHFASSKTTLSWDAFCNDVALQRDVWDNLGTVRYFTTKGKDTSKKGKKRHNAVEEDDAEEIENVEIDIHCPEKKLYADFWSFYFKTPKSALSAGFVGTAWASTLAETVPALFTTFLESSNPQADFFDANGTPFTQLARAQPARYADFVAALTANGYLPFDEERELDNGEVEVIHGYRQNTSSGKTTFARWLLESPVRSAALAVYNAHPGTSWSTAVRFASVVSTNLPEVTFEEFVEDQETVLAYAYSAASKNVGVEHGGVTLAEFRTNVDGYLEFYSCGAYTHTSFAKHVADRAAGWRTVGGGRKLVLTALPNFAWADATMVKSILKAAARLAPVVGKLTTVEGMVDQIYLNGSMPLGAKLTFQHKDKAYSVVTSIFDGILFQLLQAVADAKPNGTVIRALLDKLPAHDAAVSQARDYAVRLLRSKHAAEVADIEDKLAAANTAKPREFKAMRTTKDAVVCALADKLAAAQARDIDGMCAQVAASATSIWTALDNDTTPLMALAQQLAGKECTNTSRTTGRLAITRRAEQDDGEKKMDGKLVMEVSMPNDNISKFQGIIPTQDEVDPMDELLGKKRTLKFTPLQRAGRIESAGHSYYFKVTDTEDAPLAAVIGPFAHRSFAKHVASFLATKFPGAICERTFVKDDSAKAVTVHEVHILIKCRAGAGTAKAGKTNDHCLCLTVDDSKMTKANLETLRANRDLLIQLAAILPAYHPAGVLVQGVPLAAINAPDFVKVLTNAVAAEKAAAAAAQPAPVDDEDDDETASTCSSSSEEEDDDETASTCSSSSSDSSSSDDSEDEVIIGRTIQRSKPAILSPADVFVPYENDAPAASFKRFAGKTIRTAETARNQDRSRGQQRGGKGGKGRAARDARDD